MKNSVHLFEALIWATLAWLGTSSTTLSQPTASPNQKLAELSAATLRSKESCEKFKREAAALLGTEDSGTPLDEPAKIIELYQLVQTYPGAPQDLLDANRLIRESLDEGQTLDLEPVAALYPCEPSVFLDASKKLAVSSLNLNSNDQAKTASVLLSKIAHELGDTPSLLSTMVQLTLINTLIDKGLVEASDAVLIELIHTREDAESARRELEASWAKLKKHSNPSFKVLSPRDRKTYSALLMSELDQSQRFAHRLARLLPRLSWH